MSEEANSDGISELEQEFEGEFVLVQRKNPETEYMIKLQTALILETLNVVYGIYHPVLTIYLSEGRFGDIDTFKTLGYVGRTLFREGKLPKVDEKWFEVRIAKAQEACPSLRDYVEFEFKPSFNQIIKRLNRE